MLIKLEEIKMKMMEMVKEHLKVMKRRIQIQS